jgi:peptidoglycan/xylan/chitin deacetylase (PgdA/CDA1 family)
MTRQLLLAIALCSMLAVACGSNDDAAPAERRTPIVLRQAADAGGSVALVFDVGRGTGLFTGGGEPRVSDLLPVLKDTDVRATFALTGRWAEANPELTRAIAADGHLIINAGYDGTSFTGQSTGLRSLSAEQRALQLSRTETTIYRITNRTTQPYFHPPYGDVDGSVERDAAAEGYHVVVLGSLDLRNLIDSSALNERALEAATPGAVLLISAGARSPAPEALPALVDELRARGIELVAVDAFAE